MFHFMFKRLEGHRALSLLLACCLLFALPACGEEEPARGYAFQFTCALNEESLSPALRERAKGYADLLDALRFEGTFARSLSSEGFDLHLTVIPLDPEAASISFRLYGIPKSMMLTSPLLGEEKVMIASDSLLEFCTKGYEHLGVPFQYLALLLPYTWQFCFQGPIRDWKSMVSDLDPEGTISAESAASLAIKWEDRLQSDKALQIMYTSLGLDTGYEEYFQAFLSELPALWAEKVTAGETVRLRQEGAAEVWSSACGDFLRRINAADRQLLSLDVPATLSGFQPLFFFQRTLQDHYQSGQLQARVSMEGDENDLIDLQASAASLPLFWPEDCDSLLNVSLTGGLLVNIGFSVYLHGQSDGSLRLEMKKPSQGDEPGETMVALTGTLLPLEAEVSVPEYDWKEFDAATDILRVNETSLSPFVQKVFPSVLSGGLRFLFGIPTSSCQVILDDLTEAGILNMFLGE